MALPSTMTAITLVTPTTYNLSNLTTSLTFHSAYPLPHPSPTQALLQIHAVAITPHELSWPSPVSSPHPRIPAHDIAGVVLSTPSPVFKPGDRVFALLPFGGQGGMAEYAVCDVKYLAKIPGPLGMGFVQAASVPRAALTAMQACIGLGEGGSVLVTGATGAVGRMVVQFAMKKVGKKGKVVVIGGVGGDGLRVLGADVVVDYREVERWEYVVRGSLEGGEVDVLIDCVGGKTLERGERLVKSGGRVVTVGSPPPGWAKKDERGWEEVEVEGVKKLFFIVDESGEQLAEIAGLLERGELKTSVGLVVDGLAEEGVRDGYARGMKGGLAGSVVVKVI